MASIGLTFYGISKIDTSGTNSGNSGENNKDAIESKYIYVFFAVVGISIVLSIIFTYLTPTITGCIIYSYLTFIFLALISYSIILFTVSENKVVGIVGLFITLIYCVYIYCNRERIRIAIVILKASSNFLIEHMSSLFLSIFVGIVWMTLMILHIIGVLTLYSNPDTRSISYF